MGRELVGGLHQNQHLRVGFLQQGSEGGAHLLGEHGHQPLGGVGLHRLVSGLDGGIGVLHRGGKVPCENLRRVVVEGHGGHPARVHRSPKLVPPDDRQGVGQHGHHVGVLLDIFLHGVAHQAPADNIAHAGDVGEKRMGHGKLPWKQIDRPADLC